MNGTTYIKDNVRRRTTYISWRKGFHFKIEAKTAYKEIQKIMRAHDGRVTPELLVQEAKDSNNPLHPEIYNKDVGDAAQEYYKSRAGEILRAIVIEVADYPRKPIRSFTPVILPCNTDGECVEEEDSMSSRKLQWVSMEEALKDPELRKQVLARAKAELKSIRQKYENLVELSHIWTAIDAVE